MKYNAQQHLQDIQSELSALMMDLGLDPENMSDTSFIDLKNAIKSTYAMVENFRVNASTTEDSYEDTAILNIYLQRAKAIINARKLIYLNKIVSKRV